MERIRNGIEGVEGVEGVEGWWDVVGAWSGPNGLTRSNRMVFSFGRRGWSWKDKVGK